MYVYMYIQLYIYIFLISYQHHVEAYLRYMVLRTAILGIWECNVGNQSGPYRTVSILPRGVGLSRLSAWLVFRSDLNRRAIASKGLQGIPTTPGC